MSVLISIVTNDVRLFPLTLREAEGLLAFVDSIERGYWGAGYYHGGSVLLKKRPIEARHRFSELVAGIRTNRILCHVQDQPEDRFRPENTQPFRYRNWMFAMSGTLGGAGLVRERVLEDIPAYLRQNIHGTLPPELLFHLFLARLYEEARLPVQRMEPARIRVALRRTLESLPQLVEAHGEIAFAFVVSNGTHVFAGAHGRPLYVRRIEGIRVPGEVPGTVAEYPWVRSVFVSNRVPEGEERWWTPLRPHQLLVCDARFVLDWMDLA